ncbi:MAG: glutamate--tRNA ligase [Alphaproteobacteria bacterium]|nr:glutamate--tRNA ligase [Alphaproteobacteria bacterium]
MKTKVRFAPSPTGYLHLGNMRTALHNALFAIQNNGEFILRFDDTDVERSKTEYADAIIEDINWIGIKYSHLEKQTDRISSYEEVTDKLKANGRLYPCYETSEELEYKRRRQRARGKPPIYNRSSLNITDEERATFEAEGRKPHWRFKLDHKDVIWEDLARGHCHYDTHHISDPVLIRANGSFLYTFTSVIDDVSMDITHVIRGEDHVTNTAVQIQIFEAIDAKPPVFAHAALMTTEEGKLSKRKGSFSVRELRDEGIEPMAINNLLAKLGTPDAVEAHRNLEVLAASFDFSRFGRAQPQFSYKELLHTNAKLLHEMPFEEALQHCEARRIPAVTEDFWNAVKPNLIRFSDINEWIEVCSEDFSSEAIANMNDEEKAYIAKAAELLPTGDCDDATWKTWTDVLKEATGRKGKQLFMPLRQALTGQDHGPEMKTLLPLIGKEQTARRLKI